jgi:TonB family C-terminal domain
MMKQITYSPFRKLKLLLVLPLIAGVFYAFATPEYKFVQANPEEQNNQPQSQTTNNSNPSNSNQERTVKGKIVDNQGNPLKNATIVVSGTTLGTVSDASGNFELKMTNESSLVVTYVGYATRVVKPDFNKEMVIETKKIVVGINPDGTTSIAGSPDDFINPPLYVVDGKEMTESEMKDINPDLIESISVLKGKKHTDKYGEKGKNGVVLITLKKDQKITEKPLLFVDGIITTDKTPEDIDPKTIESVNVWKDKKAVEKYGAQGKNGVVEITTKNKPLYIVDGVVTAAPNKLPKDIESIDVLKGESATKLYGDKGKNGVVIITSKNKNAGTQIRNTSTVGNPLIVIDGVISDKKMDDIKPETIKSVNVLKGDMALKKYGITGDRGVLEVTLKHENEVFTAVEQMPEFPGGLAALKEFVRVNLQYPEDAIKKGIEGKVYVNFTITKTGAVSDVKIARSVDPLLNKEAARIVASMPNWTPGKQHGEAVEVSYTVPIDFQLPRKK